MSIDADYLGLEPDETSCRVAKPRIEPCGGTVICGGLEDLDPTLKFDLVCAFEVIEHIEDDVSAAKQWTGRLSPGGSLLLSAPAWPDRFNAWDEQVGHYRRYTPEAIDELQKRAGCTSTEHHLYGWPLGYATEFVRKAVVSRHKQQEKASMAERTSASGRVFQPDGVVGLGVQAAVWPFTMLQRLNPRAGVGVVSVGRLE